MALPPNPVQDSLVKDLKENGFPLSSNDGAGPLSLDLLVTPGTPAIKYCPAFSIADGSMCSPGIGVTESYIRSKIESQKGVELDRFPLCFDINDLYQEILLSQQTKVNEFKAKNQMMGSTEAGINDNEGTNSGVDLPRSNVKIKIDKEANLVDIISLFGSGNVRFSKPKPAVVRTSHQVISEIKKPRRSINLKSVFNTSYVKLNEKYTPKSSSSRKKKPKMMVTTEDVIPTPFSITKPPTPMSITETEPLIIPKNNKVMQNIKIPKKSSNLNGTLNSAPSKRNEKSAPKSPSGRKKKPKMMVTTEDVIPTPFSITQPPTPMSITETEPLIIPKNNKVMQNIKIPKKSSNLNGTLNSAPSKRNEKSAPKSPSGRKKKPKMMVTTEDVIPTPFSITQPPTPMSITETEPLIIPKNNKVMQNIKIPKKSSNLNGTLNSAPSKRNEKSAPKSPSGRKKKPKMMVITEDVIPTPFSITKPPTPMSITETEPLIIPKNDKVMWKFKIPKKSSNLNGTLDSFNIKRNGNIGNDKTAPESPNINEVAPETLVSADVPPTPVNDAVWSWPQPEPKPHPENQDDAYDDDEFQLYADGSADDLLSGLDISENITKTRYRKIY